MRTLERIISRDAGRIVICEGQGTTNTRIYLERLQIVPVGSGQLHDLRDLHCQRHDEALTSRLQSYSSTKSPHSLWSLCNMLPTHHTYQ
ncbi:hypothetical protein ACHAWX_001816 [Stephanocyclus meneghinianus]